MSTPRRPRLLALDRVPTDGAVEALEGAFPLGRLEPGTLVTYEQLEAVVAAVPGEQELARGAKLADTGRFRGIVARFRRRLVKRGVLTDAMLARGEGFVVCTPDQAVETRTRDMQTGLRRVRRACAEAGLVKPESITTAPNRVLHGRLLTTLGAQLIEQARVVQRDVRVALRTTKALPT